MDGKFMLTIILGNAAMSEPEHIAGALQDVARRMRDGLVTDGPIRDKNGNRVGYFDIDGKGWNS